MRHVTINLPRIAVSLTLADILVKDKFISFNTKEDTVVIINGKNCEITNKYFLDYLLSQIKKNEQVKAILRRQGPPALAAIDSAITASYTALDFEIMLDTLATNMTEEVDSVGEYVSVSYTVSNLETLAIALLQRGFIIAKE